MELLKAIISRRSVRDYKEEKITEKQLDLILKAGCAAPVGMGLYENLRITVIQNPDILNDISEHLKQVLNMDRDPLYHAPTLIIVSSKDMPFPGLEAADAGCILENMALEATEQGLGSVITWGSATAVNQMPGLKEKISLPEEYTAVGGIVVGYAKETVPEKELEIIIPVDRV